MTKDEYLNLHGTRLLKWTIDMVREMSKPYTEEQYRVVFDRFDDCYHGGHVRFVEKEYDPNEDYIDLHEVLREGRDTLFYYEDIVANMRAIAILASQRNKYIDMLNHSSFDFDCFLCDFWWGSARFRDVDAELKHRQELPASRR